MWAPYQPGSGDLSRLKYPATVAGKRLEVRAVPLPLPAGGVMALRLRHVSSRCVASLLPVASLALQATGPSHTTLAGGMTLLALPLPSPCSHVPPTSSRGSGSYVRGCAGDEVMHRHAREGVTGRQQVDAA